MIVGGFLSSPKMRALCTGAASLLFLLPSVAAAEPPLEGTWIAYGGTAPVNGIPEWPTDDAHSDPEVDADPVPVPEGWDPVLPLGAAAARERGYTLPLPIGVSVGMMQMSRDVEVTRVAIGTSGDADLDVSEIVSGVVGIDVVNVNLRVDAWLLPFLSVYGIVGHTFNESDVLLRFQLPNRVIEVEAPGGFDGPTWGVGTVLAGGYEWWFLSMDATYAKTKLDGFDAAVATRVFNGRTGWMGDLWGHPTRMWFGVAYWDTERDMEGAVPLPGGGALDFDVTQGPVNPWNPTIGFNFEFTEHYNLVFDYGNNFDDAQTFIASINARF